jgi:hypothetical protein
VPDRLPSPGPSFLRELELRVGDRILRAGMARPTTGPDDWWLTVLWIVDDAGVVSFLAVAPPAGPPPEPPLARLGPILAGSLSGLVREEGGRLAIRLGPVAPPEDPDRPWRCPLAVRAAFGFEPMRAATLRPNDLAAAVLAAFRSAVIALGRS